MTFTLLAEEGEACGKPKYNQKVIAVFIKRLKGFVIIAATSLGGYAAAEEPSATPYRPTVSNPAALSAPGWVELEAGVNRTSGGDDRRLDTLPYLVKYAFSPDWGVLLGGNMLARRTTQDGVVTNGYGDTSFALKYHHEISEKVALGLEAGFKSPTAKTGLGTGKTDYVLNGITSIDSGVAQIDLNLGVTRLGGYAENEGRHALSWAVSISRSLVEKWNVAVELSGTDRHGMRGTSQFLTALSYEWSKRTVFDFGAAAGLGKAAPDWSVFAGVTILWEKIK
ncbi:MAG: transporter [Burkholderiales bacterium]